MNSVSPVSGSQCARCLFSPWPALPKTIFPGKGPDEYHFSVPRDTIPSFTCFLVFPWVDLEVDWGTQLVFYAFRWQRDAMVEGLLKSCSCVMVSLGRLSVGTSDWLWLPKGLDQKRWFGA